MHEGKQRAALVLAALVAIISVWQADETVTAVKYWWAVKHATGADFVVSHWATSYTSGSALFAPIWLALSVSTLFFVRRRPTLALLISGTYLSPHP